MDFALMDAAAIVPPLRNFESTSAIMSKERFTAVHEAHKMYPDATKPTVLTRKYKIFKKWYDTFEGYAVSLADQDKYIIDRASRTGMGQTDAYDAFHRKRLVVFKSPDGPKLLKITKKEYATLLKTSSQVIQTMEDDREDDEGDTIVNADKITLTVSGFCTSRGLSSMMTALRNAKEAKRLDTFNTIDLKTLADMIREPYKYKDGWPYNQITHQMMRCCRNAAEFHPTVQAATSPVGVAGAGVASTVPPALESSSPAKSSASSSSLNSSSEVPVPDDYALKLFLPDFMKSCGDNEHHDRRAVERLITPGEWDKNPLPFMRSKVRHMLEMYVAAHYYNIGWLAAATLYTIRGLIMPVLMTQQYIKFVQHILDTNHMKSGPKFLQAKPPEWPWSIEYIPTTFFFLRPMQTDASFRFSAEKNLEAQRELKTILKEEFHLSEDMAAGVTTTISEVALPISFLR